MFDQFSRPVQRVSNQVNTAIVAMERMRRLVERPASLNINANNLQKQMAGIQRITQSAKIDITFNARQAVKRAQMLRNLIQKQFTGIQATVAVDTVNSSNQLIATLQRTNQLLEKIAGTSDRVKTSIDKNKRATGGWLQNLKGVAATYLSFQGAKAAINVSDDYVNTLARIDLINDGMQTTAELQEKIFAAADRARGSYSDMAGVIGKMGILAADAFSGNDELIAFSELMQKSFRVGGASTMEQQAGMYQLSQAMAAGKLQGDEFRSIMENAPMLAAAIADFTGKSKGDLKDMSAEGVITADIIKGAMFHAADDINSKFATMPKTFGDIFNQLKNHALQEFGGAIQRINEMLNSEQGQQFIGFLMNGITALASVFMWLADVASGTMHLIVANMDIVRNTLLAIGLVALVVGAKFLIAWIAAAWPILAIIAALVIVITILGKMGVTADQVVGFVTGLFRGLYALLYNGVAKIYNRFARFAEFFANVFNHPVYSVKKLFVDFVNSTLETVKKVAEALDWVFGSNLAGHITSLQSSMDDWLGEMPDGYKVIARMEEKSIVEEAKKGFDAGSNFMKGISDKMKGINLNAGVDMSKFDGAASLGGIGDIDKVKKVGKIEGTVDISSEDLKTMRELAEMKNIQNFVTVKPQLSFGDTHIRKDSDIDTLVAHITDQLGEELNNSVNAVYG